MLKIYKVDATAEQTDNQKFDINRANFSEILNIPIPRIAFRFERANQRW